MLFIVIALHFLVVTILVKYLVLRDFTIRSLVSLLDMRLCDGSTILNIGINKLSFFSRDLSVEMLWWSEQRAVLHFSAGECLLRPVQFSVT